MESDKATALSDVKKRFFAMRNGVVADTLRKAGWPHKVVFGLNVPQLSGIARELGSDAALARLLWDDREVRESRLLCAWLINPQEISEAEALAMARDVRTREEADILCWRLLAKTPFAPQLAENLLKEELPLPHYAGEALLRNLNS